MHAQLARAIALAILQLSSIAAADVQRIEVDARVDVLGGRTFASVGAYEKITGRVYFAFDPCNPANAPIVDLALAPRNADGLVEAWANFMVLQPKNPAARRGVALLEVSNRGGKASLSYFNRARGSRDPSSEAEFGDGLLMRMGLTLIWVGWQWDVPQRDGQLRLHVPIARGQDGPIEGLVRSDWVIERPTHVLDVAHRGHVAYPVSDPDHDDNVLTVRDGRDAPRRVVPRDRWRFAIERAGEIVQDRTHILLDDGFEPGKIYELVYRAQDPRVVGLGLAAVRDMISFAKYDPRCPFPVNQGIGFGVSQTGRFLRHFLFQGFNTDEHDRQAFDAMLIQTAGAGRGSFNHRFAQPSRDAHRYSAFFYPTDIFPFSSRTQTDPQTGWRDGLLSHTDPRHRPKVFYTNTGYEYWGRAASLIHTTPDGSLDVPAMDNERIYHLSSGQHFVGRGGGRPLPGTNALTSNPLDFLVTMRALLTCLVQWIQDGTSPPDSAHPRVADGTLVTLDAYAFPSIPGVDPPRVAHIAYRADYGPRWTEGIVDYQPPALGPRFATLVPQVDAFGNEVGGLKTLQTRVPLATYTPWSLRIGRPGPQDELNDFVGLYIPLARTEAQRAASGDERPSIESRYASKEAFLKAARRAAKALVDQRVLLEEDVDRVLQAAARRWDEIHGR